MTSWFRIIVLGSFFSAAALTAAGCGSSDTGTVGNPRPAQTPEGSAGSAGSAGATNGDKGAASASCVAWSSALGAQLAKGGPSYLQRHAGPVPRASGEPIQQAGPTLLVDVSGRVWLGGHDLGTDRTELAGLVRAKQASYGSRNNGAREPIYIWADPDLKLGRLAEIAAAIADSELRLVVVAAEPQVEPRLLAVPSVKRLHDQEAADRGQHLTLTSERVQAGMAACSPLSRVLDAVAYTRPLQPVDVTARAVVEALRACDCRLPERDLFEYSLLSMLGVYEWRLEWRPVPSAESLRKQRDRRVADLVAERR